jgi:hypothetical protein
VRGIPRVLGSPACGEGPFARHGVPLWNGHRIGALVALGVIPLGAVFWWGFALPLPPRFALARAILIVASWCSLAWAPSTTGARGMWHRRRPTAIRADPPRRLPVRVALAGRPPHVAKAPLPGAGEARMQS